MRFRFPHRYSDTELADTADKAREIFKQDRAATEQRWSAFYSRAFADAYARIEHVFAMTDSLVKLEQAWPVLLEGGYLDILRYMDRPSVSEDDFKNLSETNTVSARKLALPENAALAADFITRNLNTDVFPWLVTGEVPDSGDLLAAKRSVAALTAEQKTKTKMRTAASKSQEAAVRKLLVACCGYKGVIGHDFESPKGAPAAGTFFERETQVAGTRADIVLGLHDGRFMAIECKVSNSEVNSFKRLNHEVIEKVKKWNEAFGSNGVVCAAVLQGVFKPGDLVLAQDDGAFLFWSCDLRPLADFVNSLKHGQVEDVSVEF